MKKKIIVILTLILAVFLLAACSSGGSDSNQDVTENQAAVAVLNDFEKAVSNADSDSLADIIPADGITVTIGEETKNYSKEELKNETNIFYNFDYFNVVKKKSTNIDTGVTISGELSSIYAAYAMLGETVPLAEIDFKSLQETITAGVYSGQKFSLETPTDWLEYSSIERNMESYIASDPDKLENVISLYYYNIFSSTYHDLDELASNMILTLESLENEYYSTYISNLSYQLSNKTIDNLPAKELAANYEYNYFPTEVVFSLEKIDGQYYITKLIIKRSKNRKQIELEEKIYLIKNNLDFYMIDYGAEKKDFNSAVNKKLLDSFKVYRSSNALPEINIIESINDLTVNLTGNITDSDSDINKLTIGWGDGNSTTLTSGFSSVSENHFYSSAGDYTISLTAEDSDGGINKKKLDITLVSDNNYGTFLDLSAGSGSLNVKADGSQMLAIMYPRDDLGGDYNVASFKTSSLGSSLSQTEITNNLITANRSSSSEKAKYPYDGSETEYLREMREETLKNHEQESIIQSVAQISAAPQIGDLESFRIYDGESKDYTSVTTNLRGIGENVLVWTDNSISFSDRNVDEIIDEFDNNIYSEVQAYFGQEPQAAEYAVLNGPEDKVNIVITPLLTASGEVWAGGYFYSTDLYSKSKYSNSNERKMLYIHHYPDQDVFDYQLGTIAHEFQHMIFYNQRVLNNNRLDPATWLDEGFSQLAEDIVGYGYQDGVANPLTPFLDNPQDTSLLLWEGQARDYNMSYLFARYLYDRFGAGIIEEVHTQDSNYKNSVAAATGLSFSNIFKDFAFALWLDDESSSRYGFPSIDFSQPRPNIISAGDSWSNQRTRGWGINYTVIENINAEAITIEVGGADYGADYYLNTLEH